MSGEASTVSDDGSERASDADVPPRHLGRYRIDGVLGVGGMGVVLAAHDPELDRAVAIKLLRRADADAQEQLVAEAQAMARLRHAHVVTVHDVGVVEGRVFIAMELVEGVTLRAWLRASARPWREILDVMIAAARGLAAAHAAGVVHRDFKLDNVLVGDDGSVRVADFGLSSSEGDATSASRKAGTPAYMAPEQHAGEAIDSASDQFAFAVATWEALEGTRPFAGATTDELAAAKRAGPPAPRGPAPRWVFAVVRRALASEPAARYPSMLAVARALERGLGRRRRVLLAAAGVAAIGMTAATAIALSSPARGPDCELAGASVERVWNAPARMRVTSTFAATARPHAAGTTDRVTAALDRQAAALAASRVSACTATYDRGERSPDALDRQMACLDRRVGEMAALIELFERTPDTQVIDRAYEAVAALPGADTCTATSGRSLPPLAIRAQVDAAELRRAEAEALRRAGKLRDARVAFENLAVHVRTLGYAPLLADVEHGRARTIGELDDAAAGLPAYQAAAAAAAAAGDDRLIADAWLGQLELLGGGGGKPSEAKERLGFAEVAVSRAGDPVLREKLLYTRGDLELELGKLVEARADIEEALRSAGARGAARTSDGVLMMNELVRILFALGENAKALTVGRQSIELQTELLGPEHLSIAKALNNLAIALDKAGAYDEAIQLHRRALAIKERTLGPDDASVAVTLHNLGMVAANRGRHDEAIAYTSRALAIRERAFGPEHAQVAQSLSNLAVHYKNTGRYEEALAAVRRALAIRERIGGPEHVGVAFALLSMSSILIDLGRANEALPLAQRALAIREKALGPRSEGAGNAWNFVADAHEALGARAASCAARDRAAELIEASLGANNPDLIGALIGQAECRLAAHPDQARRAADRVIAIVKASEIDAHEAAPAHFVIAQILWAEPAQRPRALEEARAALAGFAGAPAADTDRKTAIERWLQTHSISER